MTNLAIGYIMSYVLYGLVGVMAHLSLTRPRLALGTIFYAFTNMLAKIIVVVALTTYGWKHVGGCYIDTAVKTSVLTCSVV